MYLLCLHHGFTFVCPLMGELLYIEYRLALAAYATGWHPAGLKIRSADAG
jgi:hypothetical protein